MPNYVFIDANNLGREMLYFEQDPDDLTPFIESQCMIFNEPTMQAIKIQPQHKTYGIGLIYDGTEFRPPQPYPSWIWSHTAPRSPQVATNTRQTGCETRRSGTPIRARTLRRAR